MNGLPSEEMVSVIDPIDLQLARLDDEQKRSVFRRLGLDKPRLKEMYREFRSGVVDPHSGKLLPAGLEQQFGLIGFVILSTRELEKIPSQVIETDLGFADVDVSGKKKKIALGLSVGPYIYGGELQSLMVKITDVDANKKTHLKLKKETREVRIPIRGDTFRPKTTYAASFEKGNASLIPGFSPLDRLRKQPLQAEQTRFITDLALGCLEQIVQENPSS